ncbi:hypothetical protein TCAL_01643 [Tigriopus californicus]|uniref:CCR4-NOT transcription complex subunit 4 n=1 Tax=Tigriopus californicus TaxID=6832 RepID=A0A553PA85_TIGCA|nr:hypothetical protein TCAL_01643 [Tigriopus californicus]|eukprot:TCALIF_01643-PA protein Name:"Similar to CNOT4 CCR4-NOT transcription complex subunit 4 (Homo sapiens)" AED:0.09 eAED:0.09 QI:153/0.75/0.66/1/0.87/1/9/474/730
MSVLYAASDEETPDCPLCMEMFELDDLNFYPCACGYQICRFCWNKILTEAEGGQGRCPACRSPYSENPVDFKPLSTEEVAKIKAEKRQKDQARKQRVSENRKHLANVRVVQKNLVFVVGLAPRLADPEVLKKPEYFGKFGKIHKVVINHSTSYAGNQNQGPSASAYVTYYKSEDALRAIQAVNNIFIEGRTLKASLGTTKYCSHFMKNQACPKHDCMYLHELGDDAASFTKEQMQQGKHTEYERSLHDEMDGWPNLGRDSARIPPHSPIPSENRSKAMSPRNEESNGKEDPVSTSESPPNDEVRADPLGSAPSHRSTDEIIRQMRMSGEPSAQSETSNRSDMNRGSGGQHPPLHTPFIGGGGGANNLATRTKAPPPGFSLNNLSSNTSVPGLNRFNGRGNFDPFGGGGGLGNLGSQSFPNMHPDLDVGNSMDGVPMGLSSRLHPAMSNLHLGSGGGGGGGGGSSSNSSRGGQNSSSWQNKDWQDGFRALLPNVNVSFGPSNSFMDGGPPHPRAPPLPGFPQRNNSNSSNSLGNAAAVAAAAGMSMPNREDNHMGMVRQRSVGAPHHPSMAARQHSWHPHPPSSADWTALDPAIVTGQLAQKGMPNIRPESPHNWIKANLEQLTSEPNFSSLFGGRDSFESNGMPLVSGYSGLSLSGGSGNGLGSSDSRISPSMMRHPNHPASLAQWGNSGSSVTPTPAPPGFSTTLTSKHNFRGASRHDNNISNMDSKKS